MAFGVLHSERYIWYQSLKKGSIRSFDELARAFRTHFVPSIEHKKKSSDLKLCYQKPGESLQSFISRFNAEAVEVGNLNDDTVIDAIKDNTTIMAFRENLITNPKSRTNNGAASGTETDLQSDCQAGQLRPRDKRQPMPPRMEPHRPVKVEDQAFIPLHTPRSHILMWIQNNNEPVGRLKDFVAQNISYISGGDNRGEHSRKREEAPPPKRQNVSGVINTIAGGMADPEYKRGRRKRQKMVMNISVAKPLPEVSFAPADGEGIDFPHQDPLVISGLIENFWVMRQFVDEGSSVNLITKQAYIGIGCSVLNLKPVKTPLVGLGGAPVRAEGVAELTVELGKENGTLKGGLVGITQKFKILFMVVDMPLAYNVIICRSMLYNTGAVTCIKYLSMKIPIEEGVVTVKGRQDIAK
ncbi:uncharacterized protein LOC126672650 [Mercurialis annua]|uniref:uncharacterized protein LOC126672650 n=1 Tax=Mercurialis annua TaxID=3986 RepID=UPI002160315B|nr:uncharacterized protein LOC126672650 [Mercurialis annua]